MSYTISLTEIQRTPTLAIVGCGGTGGFVAESMCRLLINSGIPLMLVDPDRVELHNLRRQNFFPEDVGKFKSQALAERLARQYGRRVGYSVMPYDKDMFDTPSPLDRSIAMGIIIVACVDNPLARKAIANSFDDGHLRGHWWLDAGNGHHSGQVLIGNTKDPGSLGEAFDEASHTVQKLPIPSLQLPSLLVPPTKPIRPRDCAEAVEDDGQSPTINQAMATLVLEFTYRLLKGTLTWMGAYIDLDSGTLHTVPAEPVMVARMLQLKVDDLMANKCALGGRYHLPERNINV